MNGDRDKLPDQRAGGGQERRARRRPAPTPARKREVDPASAEGRHRKWFVQFADEQVLPLLTSTVEALKRRGFNAHCHLARDGEDVTGELVIIPLGLPPRAAPPRFAVSAAPAAQGLAIDYTGTFPHAGAEGGFGPEVVYDTVYTGELEAQLLEFVRLATGA